MPRFSDNEIETLVKTTGKRFLDLPSSLDELISLLNRTEVLLTKVTQSPAKSMFTALSPLMNALVSEKLLKHSDVDVKVGVASCISEITRITAPEAPYDDETMKDVFQLMVFTFKDISDTSSRSHQKRATILETAAKLRSCVVMLDLECDEMVIEMFQHFFNAIRVDHAEHIFSSMEAIMTVIIEESEDISPDLLDPILSTLKMDNKTVQPIAKKLAERVVRYCADKLRLYLPQALKALDARLEDYSEVIASVCSGNNNSAAHHNDNILKDQSRSTKSTVANGVGETRSDGTMSDANSDDESDAEANSGDGGAEEPAKVEAKVNQIADTKGKQPNSENKSEESPDTSCDSAKQQSEREEDISGAMKKRRLGSKLLNERPKKKSAPRDEDELKNDGGNGSDSETKSDQSEKLKVSDEKNVSGRKKPQGTSSVPKKQKHMGKNRPAKRAKKDKALIEEVESKNDGGRSSDSETESLDPTEKLRDFMKRKGGDSQSRKDMVISPKSLLKSTRDEGSKEKTPKLSTKRKQTPVTGQASRDSEFGENLVGSKIKVWWPKDRMFYEGVVHSFDSAKKRHNVLYVDGDQENLNLKGQKWEFVGVEGKAVEHSSNEASSDVKKKTGTSSHKSKSKDTATKSKGKSKDDDKIEQSTKSNSSANSDDELIKSKNRSQKYSDAKASGKGKSQVSNAKSEKSRKR